MEGAEVGPGEEGVSISEGGEGEEEFRFEAAELLARWFAAR